jgi:hypothetical protein
MFYMSLFRTRAFGAGSLAGIRHHASVTVTGHDPSQRPAELVFHDH